MRCSYFLPTAIALLLVLQAAMGIPAAVEAVICNEADLASQCGHAYTLGVPSPRCCVKLREHQPCICKYMKKPLVQAHVRSRRGHHIFAVCHVPINWVMIDMSDEQPNARLRKRNVERGGKEVHPERGVEQHRQEEEEEEEDGADDATVKEEVAVIN
ncbi:hypothetical protein Taro_050744 [Colocasia esculenta]|uniref:Bifunctional inhibitor/plant lipid transfer protein/seed storage helical domain-containing protein n=1 Tax=Colocasia esculenta TaxID=4460 RepID=A0A843XF33_COLES|nr:hypothetical protein [Colocasia esculenta]